MQLPYLSRYHSQPKCQTHVRDPSPCSKCLFPIFLLVLSPLPYSVTSIPECLPTTHSPDLSLFTLPMLLYDQRCWLNGRGIDTGQLTG